jgi:hypothetical protein
MSENENSKDDGHGLLAKIKNALFEPEGVVEKTASSPVGVAAPGESPSKPAPPAPNNPMAERMMAIVMDRTTAYTALMEAITPLESYIADEASRYKAAFGIVGKTRSLEQIIQSIDLQHLPALDAETQRFQTQALAQQDQQINARAREMETLRKIIADTEQEQRRLEIRQEQLKQDAVNATAKIGEIEKEIAQKQWDIAQVNQQFEDALTSVKGRMLEAKAKVLKYLGA